jgi:hypothetical protein
MGKALLSAVSAGLTIFAFILLFQAVNHRHAVAPPSSSPSQSQLPSPSPSQSQLPSPSPSVTFPVSPASSPPIGVSPPSITVHVEGEPVWAYVIGAITAIILAFAALIGALRQ